MTGFHYYFNLVVWWLRVCSWPTVVDATSSGSGVFRYNPWDEYGPDRWYLVETDTANQCRGSLQSPIAVPTTTARRGRWMPPCTRIVPDPTDTYTADCFIGMMLEYAITDHNLEARVVNNNNQQPCSWTDDEGSAWTLQSLHVHLGWEHRSSSDDDDDTNAKQLELHLVHSSVSNGETLVIGIRFESQEKQHQNPADPLLAHLLVSWLAVSSRDQGDDEINAHDITSYTLWSPSAYFDYRGSFTTPPCTQDNVRWHVVPEIRSLSLEQFQLFQDLVMDYRDDEGARATVASDQNRTARPLQAPNGRVLDMVCSRQYVVRKQRQQVAGIVLVVAVGTFGIVRLLLDGQRRRNQPDGLFVKEDYGVLA